MRSFHCIVLVFFLSSMSLFSQEKYRQHTVIKGETVSEIAQKYKVKPSEIYELNPDAVNGIKGKTVLLIPTNTKKNFSPSTPAITSNQLEKAHEILPKETVYGIAKQHNITVADLYKINPKLEKEGLKIGQIIKIPQTPFEDIEVTTIAEKSKDKNKSSSSTENISTQEITVASKIDSKTKNSTQEIDYEVLPKETLYSIAKKHEIKLADLQKANPELGNKSLRAGQKIRIPLNNNSSLITQNSVLKSQGEVAVDSQKIAEKSKPEIEKKIPTLSQAVANTNSISSEVIHEVLPKESLYSIAKKYKITISDLKNTNPELGNKSLKVGQKIQVPVKTASNESLVAENNEIKSQKEISISSTQDSNHDKKPEIETTHEVLPKETKYGIAKEYGITVEELEKQNPNISKKLLVGSVLKIRTSKVIPIDVVVESATLKEENIENNKYENNVVTSMVDSDIVEKLISKASEHIGTPYRSGGTSVSGFDCSGLMCYTFANSDIKLPRSSIEMASFGSKIDTENAQKGDLIFFKTNGQRRINHVGMVVEVSDGEIKFIHSSNHGGVIISSTKESYYQKNLVQVNRVL